MSHLTRRRPQGTPRGARWELVTRMVDPDGLPIIPTTATLELVTRDRDTPAVLHTAPADVDRVDGWITAALTPAVTAALPLGVSAYRLVLDDGTYLFHGPFTVRSTADV